MYLATRIGEFLASFEYFCCVMIKSPLKPSLNMFRNNRVLFGPPEPLLPPPFVELLLLLLLLVFELLLSSLRFAIVPDGPRDTEECEKDDILSRCWISLLTKLPSSCSPPRTSSKLKVAECCAEEDDFGGLIRKPARIRKPKRHRRRKRVLLPARFTLGIFFLWRFVLSRRFCLSMYAYVYISRRYIIINFYEVSKE